MCGAFGYTKKDIKEAIKIFNAEDTLEDLQDRYNVRPTQMSPILYMTADGVQIKNMYWSFIPSWAKEKRLKFSTFNARDDRLLESGLYKNIITSQRCVVLASFFYEPDKINFVKPPHPWHLFRHKDKTVMCFAGLYSIWKDPATNDELYTFTIITTNPGPVVGQFHDRQPVQLNKDEVMEWLNPDLVEKEKIMELIKPYTEKAMEEWSVSDEAKNPRNEGEDLIKPQ